MCAEHASTYRFAFEERHPVNVRLYLLSQLLFQGLPGISYVVHLQGASHLESGVTLQTQAA